jgi:hypothetical protein
VCCCNATMLVDVGVRCQSEIRGSMCVCCNATMLVGVLRLYFCCRQTLKSRVATQTGTGPARCKGQKTNARYYTSENRS